MTQSIFLESDRAFETFLVPFAEPELVNGICASDNRDTGLQRTQMRLDAT